MDAGSSDVLCATGMRANLLGLLGSVLIQVELQASIDAFDFNVSTHALNLTVLGTLQN